MAVNLDDFRENIGAWWAEYYDHKLAANHAYLPQPLTWGFEPAHNEWNIACLVDSLATEPAWVPGLSQALDRPVPGRELAPVQSTVPTAPTSPMGQRRSDFRSALCTFHGQLLGTNTPPERAKGFASAGKACEAFLAPLGLRPLPSSGSTFFSQAAGQCDRWLDDVNGAAKVLRAIPGRADQASTLASLDELFASIISTGTDGLHAEQRIVGSWKDGDAPVRDMLAEAIVTLVGWLDQSDNTEQYLATAVQTFTGILSEAQRCAEAWYDCGHGLNAGATAAGRKAVARSRAVRTTTPPGQTKLATLPPFMQLVDDALVAIAEARLRIARAAMSGWAQSTTVVVTGGTGNAGRKDPVPVDSRWDALAK